MLKCTLLLNNNIIHIERFINDLINYLFYRNANTTSISKEDKYAFVAKLQKYKTTILGWKG